MTNIIERSFQEELVKIADPLRMLNLIAAGSVLPLTSQLANVVGYTGTKRTDRKGQLPHDEEVEDAKGLVAGTGTGIGLGVLSERHGKDIRDALWGSRPVKALRSSVAENKKLQEEASQNIMDIITGAKKKDRPVKGAKGKKSSGIHTESLEDAIKNLKKHQGRVPKLKEKSVDALRRFSTNIGRGKYTIPLMLAGSTAVPFAMARHRVHTGKVKDYRSNTKTAADLDKTAALSTTKKVIAGGVGSLALATIAGQKYKKHQRSRRKDVDGDAITFKEVLKPGVKRSAMMKRHDAYTESLKK